MTATERDTNQDDIYSRNLTPKGIKFSANRNGTRTVTFFAPVRYASREGTYDLMVAASGKALADIEPELENARPIRVYGVHEDLVANDGRRQRGVFRVIGLSRPKEDAATASTQQPPAEVPTQPQPEAKKRPRHKAAEQLNISPADGDQTASYQRYHNRDLGDEIQF